MTQTHFVSTPRLGPVVSSFAGLSPAELDQAVIDAVAYSQHKLRKRIAFVIGLLESYESSEVGESDSADADMEAVEEPPAASPLPVQAALRVLREMYDGDVTVRQREEP